MKYLLVVALCAGLVTCAWASEQLDEANEKFTYKSEPIHPDLIAEFSNWMSDNRPPVITTVDVSAAFDTNEYQQSEIKHRDNWLYVEHEEMDGDIRSYESFNYRWLGKMANGVHVLEAGSSGGGSGFFMDLLFVRFSEGEIVWEDKKESQLLMSIVGTYSLGDRYDGDIKVYPDKVVVPASKHQRGGGSIGKDVELKI